MRGHVSGGAIPQRRTALPRAGIPGDTPRRAPMNRLPFALLVVSACTPTGSSSQGPNAPVAAPSPEALARAALPAESRARLREAVVPVLAPPERRWLSGAV